MIEPTLNYVQCPGSAVSADAVRAPAQHRMAYWEWNATGDPQHPHVVLCVHGLSRQGRDFDTLARALSPHVRVICPDVAGRGQSDWLADPMAYQIPQYASDMLVLLAQLQHAAPIHILDWVGTSMGGLIGMALCGQPGLSIPEERREELGGTGSDVGSLWPLQVPVRRLVLNDVGPLVQWQAVQRISTYLGRPVRFDSLQQAADALWSISSSFGPHTPAQWLGLSTPMARSLPDGGFALHYDPAIAIPFKAMTEAAAAEGEASLWQLYDRIQASTLVLRGAQSDLLSADTANAMTLRGPKADLIEFEGVGHAPTLIAEDQLVAVTNFLLAVQDLPEV